MIIAGGLNAKRWFYPIADGSSPAEPLTIGPCSFGSAMAKPQRARGWSRLGRRKS